MESHAVSQLERFGLKLHWAAETHVGKVRDVNEDSFVAEPGMWIVADGMGGHAGGRVASEIVADVCRRRADGEPMRIESVPAMLDEANAEVRQRASDDGHGVMGSTICGVVLVDNGGEDALLLLNVGDSRCYQLHEDGSIVQLTTDHSYVQELVSRGEISQQEARNHPRRNVVSRAVGIEDSVAADFTVLSRTLSSRLLICSDGVSGELDDESIAATLAGADAPRSAAARLMEQVMLGSARDNATAVVLDVAWAVPEAPQSTHRGIEDTTLPGATEGGGEVAGPSTSSRNVLIDAVPGLTSADQRGVADGAATDVRIGEVLSRGDC